MADQKITIEFAPGETPPEFIPFNALDPSGKDPLKVRFNPNAREPVGDLSPLAGPLGAALLGGANEAMWNFGDDIVGLVDSKRGEALASLDEQLREDNPIASMLGRTLGSVAGMKAISSPFKWAGQRLLSAGGPAATVAQVAGSNIGKIGQRAAAPAIDIGVSELGRGEAGSPGQVLGQMYTDPLTLALIGGGAVAEPLLNLETRAMGPVRYISDGSDAVGFAPRSDIAKRLMQAGYSAEDAATAAERVRTIGREGIPYPVAVATSKTQGAKSVGPLGELLNSLSQRGGSKIISEKFEEIADNSTRIKETLDSLIARGGDEATKQFADNLGEAYILALEAPSRAAKASYSQIAEEFPKLTGARKEINELFKDNPYIQSKWNEIGEMHQRHGRAWAPNDRFDFEQLDKLQKAIGDDYRASSAGVVARRGGEGAISATESPLIKQSWDAVKSVMDAATIKDGQSLYAKARSEWVDAQLKNRGDVKLIKSLLGKTEFNKQTGEVIDIFEPEALLAQAFRRPSRVEQLQQVIDPQVLRSGFREAIENDLSSATRRLSTDAAETLQSKRIAAQTDPTKIFNTPERVEILKMLVGESTASKIVGRLDAEKELRDFQNQVFSNSRTAPRLVEALRETGGVLGAANRLPGATVDFISALFDGRSLKEQENLARALMATGEQGARILEDAAQLLAKYSKNDYSAQQAGRVVRGVLKGTEE